MAENLPEKAAKLVEDYEDEEEEEDGVQDWGEWDEEDGGGEGEDEFDSDRLRCLFCDSEFGSATKLFSHCRSSHCFDFYGVKKSLGLDFYGCFKLINFIRSQVSENKFWSCGLTLTTKKDLLNHLHEAFSISDDRLPWEDEKYLKPFLQEDPLLFNFVEDSEDDEDTTSDEKMKDLIKFGDIHINDDKEVQSQLHEMSIFCGNKKKDVASAAMSYSTQGHPDEVEINVIEVKDNGSDRKMMDGSMGVSIAKVTANAIKSINKSYFGSYSSFGIHREMISDKVRTEAYRDAILDNSSLLRNAAVLDVGCGTGILSLFAAQAGASSVIAVDASDKMAAVATQIAKDNGLLWNGSSGTTGVIRVINGMVEELDSSKLNQLNSIDVLVSEWMGYCLLYESMLSSVLLARDRWLKPGGAILPDTATMFVAGFGRGVTSVPFWENVYGFDMSCIGNELIEEAARLPIIDVVDSSHIMTNTAVLQSFDLAKMTPDEMDFTSTIELKCKSDDPTDAKYKTTTCYGVVLWFDTGFTKRFCKERPINLSTSPYTPPTHWAQTILTFTEPIAMSLERTDSDTSALVGSDAHPAVKVVSRISIARATEHRCIDISLEITGIGSSGMKRSWPVQIFSLS